MAAVLGDGVSRPVRVGVRLPDLVPDAPDLGRDGGELLSLPDAAARHAVRFLLLGEHVSAVDLMGIVPVALGIWLVTRPAGGA